MKKILINISYDEEVRIAILKNNILDNLYIIDLNKQNKKSNIYKGKVIKIEPSLNAAFIDYGENKNGFLSIKEIYGYNINNKNNIKDILFENQELIVQVIKEEKKNKCAYLSTFICLSGLYIVLMPNNNKICISKRIETINKVKIKNLLNKLDLPDNMGIIFRTKSIDKNICDIQNDINNKVKHWELINKIYKEKENPSIIYNENSSILNILKDYINDDIDEIIIDDFNILKLLEKYLLSLEKHDYIKKILLYRDNTPLFIKFNIEKQIELLFKKKINLKSGGSIIIDNTEALTAIDVNSSKYKNSKNIEDTAFNINLEASEEIAKQIRLRNISGLIVIDFIDMNNFNNNKIIENSLYKNMYNHDKAKIKINSISKFGLLELTRQRINNSINETNFNICKKCKGYGYIRNIKSLSINILRLIENIIINKKIKELHVIVPVLIASYLLNEKRLFINNIENKNKKIKLLIIPYNKIKIPDFYIYKIKNNNINTSLLSYLIPKLYHNKEKNKLNIIINKNNNYFKKNNSIKNNLSILNYIYKILLFIKNIFSI